MRRSLRRISNPILKRTGTSRPMIALEDPPGFVVRTEAQKAAWDNGFRLERGVESGGWLHYGSTTARGEVWRPPNGGSVWHPQQVARVTRGRTWVASTAGELGRRDKFEG